MGKINGLWSLAFGCFSWLCDGGGGVGCGVGCGWGAWLWIVRGVRDGGWEAVSFRCGVHV